MHEHEHEPEQACDGAWYNRHRSQHCIRGDEDHAGPTLRSITQNVILQLGNKAQLVAQTPKCGISPSWRHKTAARKCLGPEQIFIYFLHYTCNVGRTLKLPPVNLIYLQRYVQVRTDLLEMRSIAANIRSLCGILPTVRDRSPAVIY